MIYAIHKTTKKHRVIGPGDSWDIEWRIAQADPDGWIEWQSSEYEGPMPGGSRCEIRLSNGDGFIISDPEDWDWSKGGDQWIIAYRPILDAKVSHPGAMAGPDKYRADGGEWPAWDGVGMPRAGALACTSGGECEVVTTDATRGQVCVRWNDGELGVVPIGAVKPRPIRSEEDRAIEAMRAIVYRCSAQSVDDRLSALYRAGYRKTGDT